tara:strand:- start:1109 stop:1822 length:714 start_codon:yes stop_codon:yes gene_type:complete
MSFDTNRTWLYQIVGRDIHLWQYVDNATTSTLAGYRIRLPNDYYGNQLIYPNEDITDGLRIEYTSIDEPFISESLEDTTARASASNISFALSGTRITSDDTNNFWDTTSGFAAGDKIRVIGSASNDGDYTIDSFGGSGNSNMIVSGSTLTDENTGESVTIYQIPKEDSSPSETSHVNLNRMLSLACVDYVKAMLSDLNGEVQLKEYYMKEFWKKVGDSESNKRKVTMSFPIKSYSVL